jgi:hypothetical protein
MKISIIDTIFPIGHKGLNNKLISLFPKINMDILVANNLSFFDEDETSNVVYKNFNLIGQHKKYYFDIIYQIFNYVNIWFRLFGRRDDIKFFFTFENISFAFARILFINSRNVLFHHNNTDYLTIKYVRFFFKTYMNSVQHVVFAEFIKKRLIEIGVKENKIFVLTHPIHRSEYVCKEEEIKNIFIGLGYASDESLFKKIIEFEDEFKILKTNNIKLILRSSNLEYVSENITFFKGHLSEEEYTNLNCRAVGILFLYPQKYKYRYSAGILDALKYKKVIIGSNIPIVRHFKSIYPNICYSFDTIEELFLILINSNISNYDFGNHDFFLDNHDDLKIKQELEKIIFSQ